jgi:hypothetical protein
MPFIVFDIYWENTPVLSQTTVYVGLCHDHHYNLYQYNSNLPTSSQWLLAGQQDGEGAASLQKVRTSTWKMERKSRKTPLGIILSYYKIRQNVII